LVSNSFSRRASCSGVFLFLFERAAEDEPSLFDPEGVDAERGLFFESWRVRKSCFKRQFLVSS
jgi:hypothetical protein